VPDTWALIWQFITSPGFGGATALAAAGIATWVALHRESHAKESAARKAWWDTLTWVYDRTVVDTASRQPLSLSVTVGVLQSLNSQTTNYARSGSGASWDVEAHAVAALVEEFRAQIAIGSPELQAYTNSLDELSYDLERRGFSGAPVGREYRQAALQKVIELIRATGDNSIGIQHAQDKGTIVVEQGNTRILIRAVYTGTNFSLEMQPAHRFADHINEKVSSPVIVITNQPIPPYIEGILGETNLRYLHWDGEGGIPEIKDVIASFGIHPLRLDGDHPSRH